MLDPSRHDEELAFLDRHVPIAELHREAALHDEKQFILMLVVVPHEFALELHQLHVLTVQLSDDLRAPMSIEERQLLAKVDRPHQTLVAIHHVVPPACFTPPRLSSTPRSDSHHTPGTSRRRTSNAYCR